MPRFPGSLQSLSGRARRNDDVDAAIDDIFGQSTTEGPGPFDAALLLIGAGLFVWALLAHPDGIVLVGGIAALVLGSALPGRSLWRYLGARHTRRARRRAMARGYPLDASAPTTAALVKAYDDLLTAAAQPGVLLADDVRSAAHGALVEAASLLDGALPTAPAQRDYIEQRTRAINDLTEQLVRQHQKWLVSQRAEADEVRTEHEQRATAAAQARQELETVDSLDSLRDLSTLTEQFKKDDGANN